MIIGFGSDITDIRRIEKTLAKQGAVFEKKVFTAAERRKAASRKRGKAAAYAKRFAAKEACAKALGCGIGKRAGWQDIEITNMDSGAPNIALSGNALKHLKSITPRGKKAGLFLTLADEHPYALAMVIIAAD